MAKIIKPIEFDYSLMLKKDVNFTVNKGDRIGIIDKGKMLFVGTYEELKKELKENKSLEQLFMEIIENE